MKSRRGSGVGDGQGTWGRTHSPARTPARTVRSGKRWAAAGFAGGGARPSSLSSLSSNSDLGLAGRLGGAAGGALRPPAASGSSACERNRGPRGARAHPPAGATTSDARAVTNGHVAGGGTGHTLGRGGLLCKSVAGDSESESSSGSETQEAAGLA